MPEIIESDSTAFTAFDKSGVLVVTAFRFRSGRWSVGTTVKDRDTAVALAKKLGAEKIVNDPKDCRD
jgi:hypothetical protein